VLLEQLTPVERAVFLLREVFDYDYPTIAQIVEREESACRQIQHRARQHIAAGRPRFTHEPGLTVICCSAFSPQLASANSTD
jgi:RNA polymerase sigma-70 factor (ECF subfamily)